MHVTKHVCCLWAFSADFYLRGNNAMGPVDFHFSEWLYFNEIYVLYGKMTMESLDWKPSQLKFTEIYVRLFACFMDFLIMG